MRGKSWEIRARRRRFQQGAPPATIFSNFAYSSKFICYLTSTMSVYYGLSHFFIGIHSPAW